MNNVASLTKIIDHGRPGWPEHTGRPGLVSAGSGPGMIAIVRFVSRA